MPPRTRAGRGIAVAVPAWWTTRASTMAQDAIRAIAGRKITFVPDAEAAIRGYQARGGQLENVTAVLNLGSHVSSAAVVAQCRTAKPVVAGRAMAQSSNSGDELDAKTLHHLLDSLGDFARTIDRTDPEMVEAARSFLQQCREAKEELTMRSAVTFSQRQPHTPSRFTPRARLPGFLRSSREATNVSFAAAMISLTRGWSRRCSNTRVFTDSTLATRGLVETRSPNCFNRRQRASPLPDMYLDDSRRVLSSAPS